MASTYISIFYLKLFSMQQKKKWSGRLWGKSISIFYLKLFSMQQYYCWIDINNGSVFQSSIWSYFLCNGCIFQLRRSGEKYFNLLFEAIFYATNILVWKWIHCLIISIFYLKLFSMQPEKNIEQLAAAAHISIFYLKLFSMQLPKHVYELYLRNCISIFYLKLFSMQRYLPIGR